MNINFMTFIIILFCISCFFYFLIWIKFKSLNCRISNEYILSAVFSNTKKEVKKVVPSNFLLFILIHLYFYEIIAGVIARGNTL